MPRKVQGSFDLAQIAGEELAGAAVPVTMAEPPTGAATAARQDTGNGILTTMDASLASVDGKLTSGVVTNAAAASSGGASSFVRIAQGASEDKTVVKASPGTLYTLNASNISASTKAYVKMYNRATAPDVSTHFPAQILYVPPGQKVHLDIPPCGLNFGTGISFVIVTGFADNDGNEVTLGDVIVSGAFK